jgi:hypothetical protein
MQRTIDTQQTLFEELDHREGDGIEVSLLWNRSNNGVTVFVVDTKTDVSFELPVAGSDALHAFRHPFAYAARLGIETAPAPDSPSLV